METKTWTWFEQAEKVILWTNTNITPTEWFCYIYPNSDTTIYIDSLQWDTNIALNLFAWNIPPIKIKKIYANVNNVNILILT